MLMHKQHPSTFTIDMGYFLQCVLGLRAESGGRGRGDLYMVSMSRRMFRSIEHKFSCMTDVLVHLCHYSNSSSKDQLTSPVHKSVFVFVLQQEYYVSHICQSFSRSISESKSVTGSVIVCTLMQVQALIRYPDACSTDTYLLLSYFPNSTFDTTLFTGHLARHSHKLLGTGKQHVKFRINSKKERKARSFRYVYVQECLCLGRLCLG